MSKPLLALFSLLIGLTGGIALGYALFRQKSPETPKGEPTHYYYLLSDSTAARHTIQHVGNEVTHVVDTIAFQGK